MSSLSAKSYAKINLFLYITGKREDGYHDIYTLFLPIDIHDILTIERAENLEFRSNNSTLQLNDDNIIIKTDTILRNEYGLDISYSIYLDKHIPIGAGLGGGSSNAATYLKLVNTDSSLNLSEADMISIMARVGSDTVFFLDPKPKLGYGKGEILEQIDFKVELFLLVINPNIFISTKEVYCSNTLQLTDFKTIDSINESCISSYSEVMQLMYNDLERVVLPTNSTIRDIIEELNGYDVNSRALMSGSGSTIFSVYSSSKSRDEAVSYISSKYPDFYIKEASIILE